MKCGISFEILPVFSVHILHKVPHLSAGRVCVHPQQLTTPIAAGSRMKRLSIVMRCPDPTNWLSDFQALRVWAFCLVNLQ
jgi:hypothetical protein